MKTKSAEDSSDENTPAKADDGFPPPMDLPSYNDLLERYLLSKRTKTQLTVSIIEDGSYLLKMNIDPFPPLTCLIPKHDWVVTMQKVHAVLKMISETANDANSCVSTNVHEKALVEVLKKTPQVKKCPSPSPPSTSSAQQGEQRSRKSRRSLKVRFHRLGVDQYKVIGVADTSTSKNASESDQSKQKSPGRRAHKKSK
ncbi:hypothetical protein OSTOST_00965, partial [Ostertagia ostertagi]